ncbi:MAG: hypothetical protein SGJ04_05435 [Bacteroidota bacterium]|nr:hypothetical protein [Bacteroidota bacterium]
MSLIEKTLQRDLEAHLNQLSADDKLSEVCENWPIAKLVLNQLQIEIKNPVWRLIFKILTNAGDAICQK